ncbi:MAG: TPM domain-containing protein [Prosthecobacter sp.]
MRCPACRAPAIEIDAACRQCGFSLEVADRAFGIPPALQRPIDDAAHPLGLVARRRVLAAISAVEKSFPQLRVAVVLATVPDQTPATAFAFWLFNRGQLSGAMEKGGENHLVLLLIDTSTRLSTAMMGYGLEPFMKESHLQTCLQAAAPSLQNGRHGQAIEAFVRELGRQLREVCRSIPKQFGLAADSEWLDATATGDDAIEVAENLY